VKFTVSHLGRIELGEFDIKPLTIFVGKANTNKTWTAYALYGMLRALSRNARSSPFNTPWVGCPQLDQAIEKIAIRTADKMGDLLKTQEGEAQQSIAVEATRAEVFEVAHPAGESLQFTFRTEDIGVMLGVDASTLGDANATLEYPTQWFIDQGKHRAITVTWNKQYWVIAGITAIGQTMQRYAFAGAPEALKVQILPAIRWMTESVYEEAMAFPAERKGLASVLAIADTAKRELLLAPGSGLNLPSVDYIRFLSPFQRVPVRASNPSKVLGLLENEIMNGKADFYGTAEPRVFSFTGGKGPTVQMNASASFVRSMAGLDLYLRTVPNNDVIVIDEPEMNAHPEAQLQLAELFAILANQGRHVIVTTHSPYFVDHVNNLMRGASLAPELKIKVAESLKLKDVDAFISQENAAAYLFDKNGTVMDLFSEGSIGAESFADETDYVIDLYARIRDADKSGK
jgi:hypothetical protein